MAKKSHVIAPKPLVVSQLTEVQKRRDPKLDEIDQIAEGPYFKRNWYLPNYETKFPNPIKQGYVTRHYPQSKWGPLCVDEARNKEQAQEFETKRAIIEGMGFKYLVVEPNKDASYLYEQLERNIGAA